MSDSIDPESRIFRIGRECYIAYLGNERDDVNPFLRIGNSRDIPDEVHEVVTTTVINNDHVGNPLQEILIAPKFHGRYLGDTGVVATIRRFFKSFDLPVDEVTDFRQVRDGEKRHMVWFFSSGNIHLRYDDQVIFDLDRREKEDRHFVRLYEEAKTEFLRNPLRYIRQDFTGQGVVMSEGNAYWYENGEFLSLKGHPGFVALLMSQGIDPDFITSWSYNLTADVMDSYDSAVFIGFIKRVRQRRKQLRVISSEPELLRKLKLLFPAKADTPASIDVIDVSGKKKGSFRESIVSYRDGHWMLYRAGLPGMTTDSATLDGLALDLDNGTILIGDGTASRKFVPPPGFPVEFIGHEVPELQVLDKYLGYTIASVRDMLNDQELQATSALEKYLRLLKDDMSSGKTSASPLLKQCSGSVHDSFRHIEFTPGGLSWFVFANAGSILELLRGNMGDDHGLYKNTDQVVADLRGLLTRIPNPDPILPFWGDLYLGARPVLLWRATKRSFVPADLAAARDVNERIAVIANLDEEPWQEDRDRLLKLIRSLKNIGEGPLTERELELLNGPDEEKEEQEKPRAKQTAEKTEQEHRMTRRETSDQKTEKQSEKTTRGRKPEKRKRVWPWILLLLILLIGGAVAWDLSGSAPWGSVLGASRSAGDAVSPDSTGSTTGTTTADTAGTTTGTATADTAGTTTGTAAIDTAGSTTGTAAADTTGTTTGTTAATSTGTVTGTTTGAVAVDTDVAPRTLEEVRAYLEVGGRVVITEVDIHLAANEIAVINGYKDLDYRVFTGSDPNWIFPGNNLDLPGSGTYQVKKGDTIWFLAAREVRSDVERDLAIFDKAAAVLSNSSSDTTARRTAMDNLKVIAEKSRAAAMRKMAADRLVLG
jgi:outer membrane biosynthesis protein TonB